mgnify:CR=1 FL=1
MLKRRLKRDYGVSGALVAHAHGVAHLLQRFVGDGVGLLVAFGEHVAHVIHILGEFLATGAMRLKELFTDSITYAFSAPAPESPISSAISFGSRPVTNRRSSAVQNLRTCDRIERDAALGIGRTLLDELGGLLRCGAQHDGIAVRLAHLAAIQAGISGASDRIAAGSGNTGCFLA